MNEEAVEFLLKEGTAESKRKKGEKVEKQKNGFSAATQKFTGKVTAQKMDDSTNIYLTKNQFFLPSFVKNFRALISQIPAWTNLMRKSYKSPNEMATSARSETNFEILKKNVLDDHARMRADAFLIKHINFTLGSVKLGHSLLKKYEFLKKLKVVKDMQVPLRQDLNKVLGKRENWKNKIGSGGSESGSDKSNVDEIDDCVSKDEANDNDLYKSEDFESIDVLQDPYSLHDLRNDTFAEELNDQSERFASNDIVLQDQLEYFPYDSKNDPFANVTSNISPVSPQNSETSIAVNDIKHSPILNQNKLLDEHSYSANSLSGLTFESNFCSSKFEKLFPDPEVDLLTHRLPADSLYENSANYIPVNIFEKLKHKISPEKKSQSMNQWKKLQFNVKKICQLNIQNQILQLMNRKNFH